MSDHAIEVVRVDQIEPHPHADRLEIIRVWGWQCIVRRGDFTRGQLAVYIPPDFTVPVTHPSFGFLGKKEGQERHRVKVIKLRGVVSQGLLVPIPEGGFELRVGDDVSEWLDIRRYEPPIKTGSLIGSQPRVETSGGPSGLYCPKFDIESFQRYPTLFKIGEPVIITEKIHGANARYVYARDTDGQYRMFCGSRTNWWKESADNLWWRALNAHLSIKEWCKQFPDYTIYGEVFGQVQSLRYGSKPGEVFFAAFAVLDPAGRWMDIADLASPCLYGLPWVPILYRGPFYSHLLPEYSEGLSTWPGANHIREGCVVQPQWERTDLRIGRLILKYVSNTYLERN